METDQPAPSIKAPISTVAFAPALPLPPARTPVLAQAPALIAGAGLALRPVARGWARVSRRSPCTICGKPDWCTVSVETGAACCMRVPSAHPLHNGGWLYPSAGESLRSEVPALPADWGANAPTALRASVARVNHVYQALLDVLTIESADRERLLGPERQLSLAAVEANGYRTMPRRGRAAVCREVAARVGEPVGVPGFYRAAGRWSTYLTLAGPAGLLIPVRDLAGRIVGAQIRGLGTGRHRYRWLSSADRAVGVGSGSPVHVARPPVPRAGHVSRTVWVTEGPLKADRAAERLGGIVLGIAGTGCWRSSGVVEAVAALGPDAVTIAFDEDGRPATRRHADELASALCRNGQRVWLARWGSARGKGIDDLLVGGGFYRTNRWRAAQGEVTRPGERF